MNFEDEYYFIRKNETNKCLPSLQPAQTTAAMIACHHSIAEIFRQDGLSGAGLQAIKDY